MNNRIEQDHRGIKQRSYPMLGFGSFAGAARFRTAFDELRAYFRPRTHVNTRVSLAEQRRLFQGRWADLCAAAGGPAAGTDGLALSSGAHRPSVF